MKVEDLDMTVLDAHHFLGWLPGKLFHHSDPREKALEIVIENPSTLVAYRAFVKLQAENGRGW